ncbi:uncharacterized protein LOC110984400 [Acanthaster planci]|uniref:Uncharacterized protein LOC110984400 n=1 Tax=Acanthaster planci TaxID=133434 RepID=A0A8B7Z3R3_ACAPL|nr:uncharacterized protein LOC110984400 [Acanthaster planci]
MVRSYRAVLLSVYSQRSSRPFSMNFFWIIVLTSVGSTCYCNTGLLDTFAIKADTGCPYSKRRIDTCYSVQPVTTETDLSLTKARASCFRIGMDLVSWQSVDELDFIWSTIKRFFSHNETGAYDILSQLPHDIKVWTGLQLGSGGFLWVNQKEFDLSAL